MKEIDSLRYKYAKVLDECKSKTEELVVSKNKISDLEDKVAKAESEVLKLSKKTRLKKTS